MLRVEKDEEVYVTETIYNKETGLPAYRRTLLNELFHAPPDGSPSEVIFDREGREISLLWHRENKLHRTNGGASIAVDPETGVHIRESFFLYGQKRPKSRGPCVVHRDSAPGLVTQEEFSGSANNAISKPL